MLQAAASPGLMCACLCRLATVVLALSRRTRVVHRLKAIQPTTAIGVGKWAEKQLQGVVAARGLSIEVASVLHPSPASPMANRGWLPAARKQLAALGHPWPEPTVLSS